MVRAQACPQRSPQNPIYQQGHERMKLGLCSWTSMSKQTRWAYKVGIKLARPVQQRLQLSPPPCLQLPPGSRFPKLPSQAPHGFDELGRQEG